MLRCSRMCVILTVCAASQLWLCRSVSVDMHPLSRCALSVPLCIISVSVLCRGVLFLCIPLRLGVSASRRVCVSACLRLGMSGACLCL